MKLNTVIMVLLTIPLIASCGIPRKEHDKVLSQLKERNAQYAQLQKKKAEAEDAMQAEIDAMDQRLTAMEKQRKSLQAELDGARATVSMYEDETGGLAEALEVTKQDIEDLRKERAAAMRRLREYRELAKRLATMIRSGQLAVKIRNAKMVIELPNAVLFDPGKTEIKENGRAALTSLADVLQTVDGRTFLVTGHTDNVPIKVSGFESNWDLSTARAVRVLRFLQDAGVEPQELAAAGFGEYDPIASNETEKGRAQNRRTEIVLMPKIDELPEIPEDLFEQPQAKK